MAIQEASAAKSLSAANAPSEGPIYSSLVADDINAEINRIGGLGLYVANFSFARREVGNLIEIQQSDQSYVSLPDLLGALANRSYRVNVNSINGSKLKLTIAWD